MRKLILIAAVSLFCVGTTAAQEGKREVNAQRAATAMTNELSAHLDLTEEQYLKVESIIMESIDAKNNVDLSQFSTKEEGRPVANQINSDRDAALKEVLSDDQWSKYQRFTEKRMQEIKNR